VFAEARRGEGVEAIARFIVERGGLAFPMHEAA
jgi:hypothetical protein